MVCTEPIKTSPKANIQKLKKGLVETSKWSWPCQSNPKQIGSKTFQRYEKYKLAKSVDDARSKGAKWDDLTADFEKAYLKFTDAEDTDMGAAPKRAAPEGTPDREAEYPVPWINRSGRVQPVMARKELKPTRLK